MATTQKSADETKSGPKLEPYQIIVRPIITEKATHFANPPERYEEDEEGKRVTRVPAYTFEVHPQASKTAIKQAIEVLFHVEVTDVRTQNRRGKLRRYRTKVGRTRNWKKAIVKLRPDQTIDFF
jgi:large subunit ribosomal protein L23